ncbi:hypothetical protein GN156_11960 [bacterium LRH843]|nr:hypothetical protein [bacterium LRH843]
MSRSLKIKFLIGIAIIVVLIVMISVFKPAQAAISEEEVRAFIDEQFAGTIDSFKLVKKNGTDLYEIELIDKMNVYEIIVDPYTGDVLSLSQIGKREMDQNDGKGDGEPISTVLPLEEVKKAVERVIGEEITILENELDEDNGRLIYDLKIREQEGIAELEVDAQTGEVLVYKLEEKEPSKENILDDEQDREKLISENEAKQIALSQVSGKLEDIGLEEENGRFVYHVEIELEAEENEAEIMIDAVTGEVITIIWEE